MAAPAVYDEQALTDFMHRILGYVAVDLGFDNTLEGPYQEAVNETLLAFGDTALSDLTSVSQRKMLRAVARVQAWMMAVSAVATAYDVSDGGQSLKRSQMMKACESAIKLAKDDLALLPGGNDMLGNVVRVHQVVHLHDPYPYFPESLRGL